MVNTHFSLLPRWRGAAPVERSILAGDRETGTCLMQLEEGLDTGPIFDVRRVPIRDRATADELRHELVAAGVDQLLTCLGRGLADPVEQVGEAVYAAKFLPDEFRIDWTAPCAYIDRLVRLGAAWTTFRGRRLRVHAAVPSEERSPLPAGTSLGLGVVCGDGGVLTLGAVQAEGKPAMDARSWANGARPDERDRYGD
jgi:methionyl-tRNA formyltransferase